MHITLPKALEEMIRRKVESGLYDSPSEVVREALRMMSTHEEYFAARLRALNDALVAGEESPIDEEFSFDRLNLQLDADARGQKS